MQKKVKWIQGDYLPLTGFLFGAIKMINTGNNTRLVSVADKSVTEVSQPSAKVPPKLLPQKIMKPAVSTSEVYMILNPV